MRQVESELKFAIGEDAPLPAPGDLAEVGPVREHRMRAVYLDTPDLLLVRHRITLRRREGGADAGWHLKLPRPDGTRLEVHAPLGEGPGRMRVPQELRDEVRAALGHAWPDGPEGALLPAAVLTTHRLEVDLLDPDRHDVVLAQLCDDRVTALPEGSTWRELEVELVDGDQALLGAVADAFADQGVTLADHPSKLSRALGDRPARAGRGEGPAADGPAADVVLAYLAAQVAVVVAREDDVRADVPDAVHRSRVATRRLRSALRTFRRLLDREVSDPLREEIRWFATALGQPRDAEVMRDHLLAALDELPEEEVVGPVRQRVRAEADRRHAEAHQALVEVMDSDRYRELVDRLLELLAEPPWRGRASRRAGKVLPDLVARAVGRARVEARSAAAAEGVQRLHLLHEARKRAKAVRYACEALAPALGKDAAQAAATWEQVTETLGAVQDAALAAGWLREIAGTAERAGEPTYTYGVLAGRETARAEAAEEGEAALRVALEHPWP
ncbi:CYTH and CHAD domain-containing protein [Ornithinimicrobium pekingense]|uniref:CHAD domain-containing protein n=1 Tax=Ornithinimicrobium pekingense TaxID=384677 RepID=A0ABQ2F3J7_9MICO|nr:CYTH and CHAD domain-containing protein [Ornithinimicrobium pekingense]GGK57218.1 CHAD domain-containing protein [Ornithinimicrobium pekingense]